MKRFQTILKLSAVCVLALAAGGAAAVDGVVLIDQNKALAGNVTPGDAPGFPITISQPGSYRLSGNLTVPNEFTGAIVVAVSDVSIDLNGFGIFGPGRPSNDTLLFGRGIQTEFAVVNVSVRNGTVAGMGGSGIDLGNDGEVVGVRSHNNAGVGINVNSGSLVSGNTVSFNRFGIWTERNSVVRDNVVRGVGRGGEIIANCFGGLGVVIGNVASGGIVGAGVTECTRSQNSPGP